MIIGAGPIGLGSAAELRRAGVTDVVVAGRTDRVGTEITGLSFDHRIGAWTAKTRRRSTIRARSVVLATGPLADPTCSDIRGIDTFTGHRIHSAAWDAGDDFAGKRVAVIGTGASAVQIVPELVRTAAFVKVFQRTPRWVLPRIDTALHWAREVGSAGLLWDAPMRRLIAERGKAHLRRRVEDPWLRRQLTPDFAPGCKPTLISSDYYPALQRDNCKLISWPIATLSPVGIRTSDGIEHHLDAIVFATGYDVHPSGPPFPVTGLDGRSLQQDWARRAEAYKNINAHGYPNLFFMTGPHPEPGHHLLPVSVESKIAYAVAAITTLLRQNLRYLDVRAEVQHRYHVRLQAQGNTAAFAQYRRQMHQFRSEDYIAVADGARPRVTSTA